MNREIKSVKLKNDFRTYYTLIPKGTELKIDKSEMFALDNHYSYSVKDIIDNTTDLFEIEYESEPKSITVKIEYENVGDSNLTFTVEKITNFIGSFFQIKNIKVTEVKNV